MVERGGGWLLQRQREDGSGGMGGGPTIEETALAVIALAGFFSQGRRGAEAQDRGGAVRRGREWLCAQGVEGVSRPAPIGLYFALLWYHEKMYPVIWTLEALCCGNEGLL
ncbi:MAG: hypothetical protein FWH21_08375, partial [Kiritimatiellaeota bacterium]|nr:hypothetical protein [Kiritimatiellota bacterium]